MILLSEISDFLKKHYALSIAVVIGACHYNGNSYLRVFSELFGVGGMDEPNIYLSLTFGFMLFFAQIFILLCLSVVIWKLISAFLALFRGRNLSSSARAFLLIRHWLGKFSIGGGLVLLVAGSLFFSPYYFAQIMSARVKAMVDQDGCVECEKVITEGKVYLGKIVASDPNQLAIYIGNHKSMVVRWESVVAVEKRN